MKIAIKSSIFLFVLPILCLVSVQIIGRVSYFWAEEYRKFSKAWDLAIEHMEVIDKSDVIVTNLKLTRVNRSTSSVNGNITMNPPLTETPEKYYVR